MGQQISTWDASQLALALGAIDFSSIGGFGENSIVKLTKDDAYFGIKKGADGSVTRFKILARVAKVVITLLQSSTANDLMSAALLADYNVTGGAGITSFNMKDLNGTTLVHAAHAFIEAPPDLDRAAQANENEWTIVLMDATMFVGGNPPL